MNLRKYLTHKQMFLLSSYKKALGISPVAGYGPLPDLLPEGLLKSVLLSLFPTRLSPPLPLNLRSSPTAVPSLSPLPLPGPTPAPLAPAAPRAPQPPRPGEAPGRAGGRRQQPRRRKTRVRAATPTPPPRYLRALVLERI